MKKLIVIPIMFLYLLAVTGVMIHTHYCGQELASWQVYANDKDGCKDDVCTDVSDNEGGCCRDNVIVAKVSTEQEVSSYFKVKAAPVTFILPAKPRSIYSTQTALYEQPAIVAGQPNAPPGRWQQIPLFKLHSRFTYYG